MEKERNEHLWMDGNGVTVDCFTYVVAPLNFCGSGKKYKKCHWA